jgi:hypothetical protein
LVQILAAVAAFTITGAADLPPPSKVTYMLGGIMSGPYRLSVDLATGEVEVATAKPRDPRPSADLPVTQRFTAPETELVKIRALAVAVWAYGASNPGEIIERGRRIELRECQASSDAMGNFDITRGTETRSFDFSQPCLSAPANLLLDRLLCLPRPDAPDCGRR